MWFTDKIPFLGRIKIRFKLEREFFMFIYLHKLVLNIQKYIR